MWTPLMCTQVYGTNFNSNLPKKQAVQAPHVGYVRLIALNNDQINKKNE